MYDGRKIAACDLWAGNAESIATTLSLMIPGIAAAKGFSTIGKGLGKLGLNFLKEQAKNAGDNRIILNVNKQNPSYHFYVSQSFSIHEETVLDVGKGFVMDDYIMEIKIKK